MEIRVKISLMPICSLFTFFLLRFNHIHLIFLLQSLKHSNWWRHKLCRS